MLGPRIAAVALVASGCASMAHPDIPAVIIESSPESRAELLSIVTSALQRTDVMLVDDALMSTSMLLLERTPARDSSGQRLSGRDFDRPEQFLLVTSDGRCMLIHQRTNRRYELRRTRCRAESA